MDFPQALSFTDGLSMEGPDHVQVTTGAVFVEKLMPNLLMCFFVILLGSVFKFHLRSPFPDVPEISESHAQKVG